MPLWCHHIIAKQEFKGFRRAQTSTFLSDNDGEASDLSLLWGGGDDATVCYQRQLHRVILKPPIGQ
jgi:hypothetical protein